MKLIFSRKAQTSIELIFLAGIIIVFSATITSLFIASNTSTNAMAFIKTATINALSNESFNFFIRRIDFFYEGNNPEFVVLIEGEQSSFTPPQEICSNFNSIRNFVKNNYYSNVIISFKYNNQEIC
jgi:uncharacterized protein (UPF0333 family)